MSRALFSLLRAGVSEVTFYGEIYVLGDGVDFSTNERITSYPARSLLKPFQFLAAGLAKDTWTGPEKNRFVACTGSISATAAQVEALEKWYATPERSARIGKICFAPTYPMDETNRVRLKEAGVKPKFVHHNCFSKHMGILEGCVLNGWSLDHYNSVSHPYHKRLMTTLSALLGEELSGLTVPDGCLLPSPVLTLKQMAGLYRALANPKSDGRLKSIRDLMLSDPDWVGGPGRFDTKLMQENPGRVIAKEGADGLLGIAVLPSEAFPGGAGIIVKALSGYSPILTTLAIAPVLKALGLNPVGEAPKGQTIEYGYQPFKKDRRVYDLSPALNEKIANWPGDVPFRRSISMDAGKGQHLTLSSIETSLHVGTHTDAPNHCTGNAAGIDEVSLALYRGPAQVITVKVAPGQLIHEKDLIPYKISASRVLVRTNSFPDPAHFNTDFVAFTAEAILWLADRGVKLVGIDTPSIDAFDSKALPAHHATQRRGLAILEGVVLSSVADGIYELTSLPLRIQGGDASPVRAILEPID